MKESDKVWSKFLQKLVNDPIISGKLLGNLKSADVTPVSKMKTPLDKTNYRQVSVLPTISKIFEKLIEKQLNHYIQNYLSPYLCEHRKGYSTQQALLVLIESWKKRLDIKVLEEQF